MKARDTVLPTPADLRELSHRFRQAAQLAPASGTRTQLASYALALAQLAEQTERDASIGEFVRTANIELYNRVLSQGLDERTRATVEMLLGKEEEALDKKLDEIRQWRMKAEELRTVADQFMAPSPQEALRRAADNYDKLANYAESQVAGTRRPEGALRQSHH